MRIGGRGLVRGIFGGEELRYFLFSRLGYSKMWKRCVTRLISGRPIELKLISNVM